MEKFFNGLLADIVSGNPSGLSLPSRILDKREMALATEAARRVPLTSTSHSLNYYTYVECGSL
jgi:hypothetical protein